jgi:polyhydroxyalkanoate synthesis repressor PhaR
MSQQRAQRVIKKYPNRRLYDTTKSCYITLEDIKKLVINYTEFCVIDSQTEEDITNTTLLQVINELERSSSPIFTAEILKNIIRFYGNAMQSIVSQYIENGIALFAKQQADFMSSWQSSFEQLLSTVKTKQKSADKMSKKT